jgi:hypothetical protein
LHAVLEKSQLEQKFTNRTGHKLRREGVHTFLQE